MSKYKVEIAGINTSELKVLSKEEMTELFIKYQSGDESAKSKIIEGNLKLVLSLVQRTYNSKFEMNDLFQIGCLGLVKAVENFSLSHNVMFSTYAVPMILGEIRRYIRDNNSLRISRSINENAYKILKFKDEYEKKYNKEATTSEISEALGFSEYDISLALDSLKEPMSMFEPIYSSNGDSIYLEDQVADTEANKNISELIALKNALLKLNKREASILYSRYIYGLTQAEVASTLNISQAQVSRLEKSAIKNVRKQIN